MTTVAYGLRHAVESVLVCVDISAIRFDADRQISLINQDGVTIPAMKHSTGSTSTNTANQDNKGGSDTDSDHTED